MTTTTCSICTHRPAELALFPHYAAFYASGFRPHTEICSWCAHNLITARQAERASPFAVVRTTVLLRVSPA